MNKSELVEAIVKDTGLSKKDATKALDSTLETIMKALKKANGKVQLAGFGTFEVRKRKARKGINPQTKEEIKIKASKIPAFRPAKKFKDMV